MNWIIEGAKRAIDKNFHTTLPDVVEAAIQAYREDNDWLGQFPGGIAVRLIHLIRKNCG